MSYIGSELRDSRCPKAAIGERRVGVQERWMVIRAQNVVGACFAVDLAIKMVRVFAFTLGVLAIMTACVGDSSIRVNTIHDLYAVCTSSALTDRAYCKGVIEAVFSMIRQGGNKDPLAICISVEGISDGQMLQAVTRWHDAHQDHWSDPAVVGVGRALHGMYPCSK